MATTSLWHIKGRIDQLINYVENPDKTEDKDLAQLAHIIRYTENPLKTEQEHKRYVSGIHCIPELAVQEFILTKKQWNKLGGRIAFHGYQSFYPGETDPDTAHKIGLALAKEMWGDKYQVVVTTHLDKGHLHNHFAVNSVSFKDGKKYDRTNAEYARMQKTSDRICREHGLSVVERPKDFNTPRMIHEAEKRGELTLYTIVRQDIDFAVRQSKNMYEFKQVMEYMGYSLRTGKYLSLTFEGGNTTIRSYRLGDDYTVQRISERVANNREPTSKIWAKPPQPRYYHIADSIPKLRYEPEYYPLMAVYNLFLSILMVLLIPFNPRYRGDENRRHYISPTLRAEIRKLEMYSKQARFLVKYDIKDLDELHAHKQDRQEKLEVLENARYEKNKVIAKEKDPDILYVRKAERGKISEAIAVVRNEIKLCDVIEERSKAIQEKLEIQRAYFKRQENLKQKNKDYER